LSNTGAASATELLITCRTSAVAVCRSSDSRVSLKRRAFWIAITACSAKMRSNATCLSVKAPASARPTHNVPIARPSDSIGAKIIERSPIAWQPSRDRAGMSAVSTSP
jgi:hypothetical protein